MNLRCKILECWYQTINVKDEDVLITFKKVKKKNKTKFDNKK
jgi:hypothetical protein